ISPSAPKQGRQKVCLVFLWREGIELSRRDPAGGARQKCEAISSTEGGFLLFARSATSLGASPHHCEANHLQLVATSFNCVRLAAE
ncbi:MAG: hypothetical protein IJY20_07045, partial [Clostridia bacterium]|nr:hypothetical protein [Clostridia bacterium]